MSHEAQLIAKYFGRYAAARATAAASRAVASSSKLGVDRLAGDEAKKDGRQLFNAKQGVPIPTGGGEEPQVEDARQAAGAHAFPSPST